MKRRKAFTLIEVITAIGLIAVLTIALVLTVRSQVEKAQKEHLNAVIQTVNTQITIANQTDSSVIIGNTLESMVTAGIISSAQQKELSGKVSISGSPPQLRASQ